MRSLDRQIVRVKVCSSVKVSQTIILLATLILLSYHTLFVFQTLSFEISVLENTESMTLRKIFWYELIKGEPVIIELRL